MIAPKKFDGQTAAAAPEFQIFLTAVTTFTNTDGAGIDDALANEKEVSCTWKAFQEHYNLSADVLACVRALRRSPTLLESRGLSWSHNSIRITAKKQAAAAVAVAAPAVGVPERVEAYSERQARRKFGTTNVSKWLRNIQTAFRTKGGDENWNQLEHETYLELYLKRSDKLRPKRDATLKKIADNLLAFVDDMGVHKDGNKRHDKARALNTVLAATAWAEGSPVKRIAKALGVHRRHRAFANVQAYRTGMVLLVDDSDSGSGSDSGSDRASESSDDEDDEGGKDDEDDEDDEGESESEGYEGDGEAPAASRSFSPKPAQRKDKRDVTCCGTFWHEVSQLNMDSSICYVCGGNEHKQRLQTAPAPTRRPSCAVQSKVRA